MTTSVIDPRSQNCDFYFVSPADAPPVVAGAVRVTGYGVRANHDAQRWESSGEVAHVAAVRLSSIDAVTVDACEVFFGGGKHKAVLVQLVVRSGLTYKVVFLEGDEGDAWTPAYELEEQIAKAFEQA